MGDRRQIYFKDMNLWYYTHWGGYSLIKDLQNALTKAKSRWGDDPYCFRIVLSQLVGEDWNRETGHGLTTYSTESEYDFDPIVNIKNQIVSYEEKDYSFQEFIDTKFKTEE